MEFLEMRFYPREEIAAIVGLSDLHDSHFAEKVQKYLNNCNYKYEYTRKGVTINKRPETAEERLQSLLRDKLKLDNQTNAYNFACFIAAFDLIDGFDSMPWDTRGKAFEDFFGLKIPAITMSRWMKKIYNEGAAEKMKKATLWKTTKDEKGAKHQERQDPDSREYRQYCAERSGLLEEYQKAGMTFSEAWGQAIKELSADGVYYYCGGIVFNAFGDTAEEIARLVDEVMAEHQED